MDALAEGKLVVAVMGEGHLPKERFVWIDKGTILNLKYVTQFEKYMITLVTGENLMVSRRLRSVVQEKLMDYWGGLY